jgi:hypothetical protein
MVIIFAKGERFESRLGKENLISTFFLVLRKYQTTTLKIEYVVDKIRSFASPNNCHLFSGINLPDSHSSLSDVLSLILTLILIFD